MNYIDSSDLADYASANVRAMDIWELYQDETARIAAACTQATQIIDQFNYVGAPQSPDNAFPRTTQESVPETIVIAACEIALALLDGVDPELEADAQQATSMSIDGVRTTYDRASKELHVLAGVPSRVAWCLMSPWLRDINSIFTSRV